MSRRLNEDHEVLDKGRNNPLKDVEVPLREQQISKLVSKLEEGGEGKRTVEVWNQANVSRAPWLSRQQTLMQEYDEFLEPIYEASQSWSSTLHLPIALTVAKTMHARFNAALFGVDPPFTVKARQAANEERAPLIQELMRYTLNSWVNNYKGVDEIGDAWLWNWVTAGVGLLKVSWDRKFSRWMDVEERQVQVGAMPVVDPQTGQTLMIPQYEKKEEEVEKTEKVFEGPRIDWLQPEDLVIVGGGGDPQDADEVIQQHYMTAGELWALADQKIFRREAVEKIIDSGENYKSGEVANEVKRIRTTAAGSSDLDKDYDLKRYQILERYAKIDVDGSGIPADVVLWVHKETSEIARATYLRRINKSGQRPFVKIDFHKRHGEDYGVGIVELLYSLTKEIDAMHNIKVDFGLLSSLPFGFYRPTNSLSEERLPMEPGSLIPLDNPQTDVYFPQLGNRSTFADSEESRLYNYIERLTAISDLSLGIIGGQGASRTATGVRSLLGESNANLDVFLRRMNRGWRVVLQQVFNMLQEKMPPGLEFRIFGDDGKAYFRTLKSKAEICGMFDFELEPNSANSNKQIQLEQANQLYQLTGNPLDIQLQIITPLERYEAMKNLLQTMGIRDYGRFLRKPEGLHRVFTPEEVANRVLMGVDVRLTPEQDLQGFLDYFQEVMKTDELLGQFSVEQTKTLARKAKEAQGMMQAMQAQAAQVANTQQIQQNAALGSAPLSLSGSFNAPGAAAPGMIQ